MADFIDKIASLTPSTRLVICDKATEAPHSGAYNQGVAEGTYLCRRCGKALFRAHSQFSSGCGWPSFDEGLNGAMNQLPDNDGMRTEIVCSRCEAHLGHVFLGEHLTEKNCRYCVNSVSIDFVSDTMVLDTEELMVAGGCFWGVDYYLRRFPGVLKVEVGYSQGMLENPSYEMVCRGDTGHYEAVRVIFDLAKTDYASVLKHFFEIHDPTQAAGQGPDIGSQYQSAVFYYNELQQNHATRLMNQLREKGFNVKTRMCPVKVFWPAELYHQNYYDLHHQAPSCHCRVSRFN